MDHNTTDSKVLEELTKMILEVLGSEYEPLEPITMTTKFNKDLEMESIEFVALAEKVQKHYGEEADLVRWFSQKGLDDMINLSVGELVEYIDNCKN